LPGSLESLSLPEVEAGAQEDKEGEDWEGDEDDSETMPSPSTAPSTHKPVEITGIW
jgi:hypothetical protein